MKEDSSIDGIIMQSLIAYYYSPKTTNKTKITTHTHTHTHTVQTDRGEGQCWLTEILGEDK